MQVLGTRNGFAGVNLEQLANQMIYADIGAAFNCLAWLRNK